MTFVALLCAVLTARPAHAQCPVGELPAPASTGDLFGVSLALHDGVAIVGNGSGLFGNAPCYVFEEGAPLWTESAELAAGGLTTAYGHSVSLWGERAVVAGQSIDVISSVGYVFRRLGDEWVLEDVLEVSEASFQLDAGLTVAIEEDVIVLTSSFNQAAWVFRRQGDQWEHAQTLLPEPEPTPLHFGASLSLRDGRAVVGGAAEQDGLPFVGTAWVFEEEAGAFVQTGRLLTSGGETHDGAGRAIAQGRDVVVMGAPSHDHGQPGDPGFGVAFVFERQQGDWVQTQVLVAPAPVAGDAFGWAVLVQDDALVLGAPGRDLGAEDAGAAYVYHDDGAGYVLTATLHDPTPERDAGFGRGLAADGDTLLVGAPLGPSLPSVTVIRGALDADDWQATGSALGGSAGVPCLFGSADPQPGGAAAVGFVGAVSEGVAWLVVGASPLSAPLLGGTLVPAPDLLLQAGSDAAGSFEQPFTWPLAIPAGTTLWLQAWIEDEGAPFGFSATNGLVVLVR